MTNKIWKCHGDKSEIYTGCMGTGITVEWFDTIDVFSWRFCHDLDTVFEAFDGKSL